MRIRDVEFDRARRLTRIEFRYHPTDTPELQDFQLTQHLVKHRPINVTWYHSKTMWAARTSVMRGRGKLIGLTPNIEAACRFADMGTRYFNVLIGCEFTRYNFCEAQANLDLLNYSEAYDLLRDWATSFGLNPNLFEHNLNLYAIQT